MKKQTNTITKKQQTKIDTFLKYLKSPDLIKEEGTEDIEFYTLEKILKANCDYNIILGQKANGKTFQMLYLALINYVIFGKKTAILRRWDTDFKNRNGQQLFNGCKKANCLGVLGSHYTSILYRAGCFYLCNYDEDGKVSEMSDAFAYAFALSQQEHDRGGDYSDIDIIYFDEMVTRAMYLPDEYVTFYQIVSNIRRRRPNIKVYMVGNTINPYCPYFEELGISYDIKGMKPGDFQIFKFSNKKNKENQDGVTFAVEMCKKVEDPETDRFFDLPNPKLKMITEGIWELPLAPHLPLRYTPDEILVEYFIVFDKDILHAEIIQHDDMLFTFVHRKTTQIKNPDEDIVFSPDVSPRPNYRRRITHPNTKLDKFILSFYNTEKVFYQDNTVAMILKGYLDWCQNTKF